MTAKRKTMAANKTGLLGEKITKGKTEMEKRQERKEARRKTGAKQLLPKIKKN